MALHHVDAGQAIDLQPLGAGLTYASTAAIVKPETFEPIRLMVRAGSDFEPHKVDGPITLCCLEGRALLHLPTAPELSAGQWMYLDGGELHSISVIEDTSFPLAILFSSGNKEGTSDADPTVSTQVETEDPAAIERLESLLDEGLAETFPASDPVAVSNPSTGIRINRRRGPIRDDSWNRS
jgi:quercetin dioxygenase-like cupin family protein